MRGFVRCARAGCSNPRELPDRYLLGLCAEHNRQFANGTIGKGLDTACREFDPASTRELLLELRRPGESIRGLSRRVGISKDAIRKILSGQSKTVRSRAFLAVREAMADQDYEAHVVRCG